MKKTKWNVLILSLALTLLGVHASAAPQPGEQSQNEQTAKKEAAADEGVYRVIYKVSEMENGKTVNSRSYTIMASAGAFSSMRIGSRIPYSSGKDLQYQDVGMDIDCKISKLEVGIVIRTNLDMTTIASKEATPASAGGLPVLRHLRLTDDTFALLTKPALVGSIEDIASDRHYEIEVTVTEAK